MGRRRAPRTSAPRPSGVQSQGSAPASIVVVSCEVREITCRSLFAPAGQLPPASWRLLRSRRAGGLALPRRGDRLPGGARPRASSDENVTTVPVAHQRIVTDLRGAIVRKRNSDLLAIAF